VSAAPRDPRALERELRSLAADVEWPAAPDLESAVMARLERHEGPAGRGWRGPGWRRVALPASPLALAAIALLVLLVAAALVPPARSAILRLLGLTHGARIVRVDRIPRVSQPNLDLGARTTLAAARPRLGFAPRLPAALGPPQTVRYSARIAGGALTLSWPDGMLTEFRGQAVPMLQKDVTERTRVRRTSVGADRAYFLTGAPHQVFLLDRNGRIVMGSRALVRANVLLWDADGLSFRLETRRDMAGALAVARSLRR
jgi:hypothetical protein